MPTITITISAGYPSKHYPPEERARTGATDYDVSISAGDDMLVIGGITLRPDKEAGGRLGSCGSPTEVWVSSSLITFLDGLTLSQRSQVFEALETGCSISLDLEPPFALRDRVEARPSDDDAGLVLSGELTRSGWIYEIGWDTGVRTTVVPDEIRAERSSRSAHAD